MTTLIPALIAMFYLQTGDPGETSSRFPDHPEGEDSTLTDSSSVELEDGSTISEVDEARPGPEKLKDLPPKYVMPDQYPVHTEKKADRDRHYPFRVSMNGARRIDLHIEADGEILTGWDDGGFDVDWTVVSGLSEFTVKDVEPGIYHFNFETISGYPLETSRGRFLLNSPVKINGEIIPLGSGHRLPRGEGGNFCINVR